MRRALAILCAMALLIFATAPSLALIAAAPPDESRAGMCDAFDGLAFTFCVAICEARACDLLTAEDERCAILERGFDRVTEGDVPPCMSVFLTSAVAP